MAELWALRAHIARHRRDRPSERSGTALRRQPSAARPFHLSERHDSSDSDSNHDHIAAQHRPNRPNHQLQCRRPPSASVARARRHGLHRPQVLVPVVVVSETTVAIMLILFRQRPKAGSHHLPHHLQHLHSQMLRSRHYRARWHPEHPRSSLHARGSCNIFLVVCLRGHLLGYPDAQRRMRQ